MIELRTTAVVSIRRFMGGEFRQVGFSGRCDCGRREDHLFDIEGNRAYDNAKRFALYHKCGKKERYMGALVGG